MSKAEELEKRLAVIERRLDLIFQDAKQQGRTNLVHHWKRAPEWCAKMLAGEQDEKKRLDAERRAQAVEDRRAQAGNLGHGQPVPDEKPTGWVGRDDREDRLTG